jgi:hypothetical protein
MEIVGVVKDFRYRGIRGDIPRQCFIPYVGLPVISDMTAYVRSALPPDQVLGMIRRTVAGLDRNLPVYNLRTLETTIDASLLNERIVANLSAIFGALATLLAVIGLYGVMAYTVEQRTREIGIRVALGAQRGNVVWLVMKEVVAMVASASPLAFRRPGCHRSWSPACSTESSQTTPSPSPQPWLCSRASPCWPATSQPPARRVSTPSTPCTTNDP